MKAIKKINFVIGGLIIAAALMFTTSCQKKETANLGTVNQIGTGNTKSSNWNSYVFQPNSNMYGHSYSEWSATWWKWLMELPVAGNPSIDDPSFNVISGQSGNVWYLAEPFGTVARTCIIPASKSLFVGLLSAEGSNLEGLGTTAAEQLTYATWAGDHIINLFASIDEITTGNLTSYRFASPQFTFNAPTPWIFGATGGPGNSVGDGYYLMLKPLSPGTHILHFGGEFHFTLANDGFDADYPVDMTYNLTVQ